MQHDDVDQKKNQPRRSPAEIRAERLKAELRVNLARRKQQARARRVGAEDSRPGTLMASDDSDDS
jgi:hypothetical protein